MLWKGFQKPKRLATDTETLTDKYGMFWAQPFERGFGTTVGNALRRVLLSSIEGAAVTAVKIEGVLHEFQSIPGVVEDATDIILNLKQIPFKLSGDAPKAIYLRADQPGVVTSGMIEADADVEVLDKDVYIATVSEGGKLDMEMRLKRGRGYVSADKNFDEDLGIGFIPIDSVHSDHRLRQADSRNLDQRLHHACRFAWPGGEVAEGPYEHLHQLRGRDRDRGVVG
jgi:DNA-directed RNA polymerase subunit alpha